MTPNKEKIPNPFIRRPSSAKPGDGSHAKRSAFMSVT